MNFYTMFTPLDQFLVTFLDFNTGSLDFSLFNEVGVLVSSKLSGFFFSGSQGVLNGGYSFPTTIYFDSWLFQDSFIFFTTHELSIVLLLVFFLFLSFFYEDMFLGFYSFFYILFIKLRFVFHGIIFGVLGTSVDLFFVRYIWNLFFLILCINFSGLIPYFYTLTSQAVDSIALGFISFGALNIYGFYKWGFSLGDLLLPGGAPKVMAPLLVPVEFLSYTSRAVSLGVRLFANIMAGHTLLKIFSGIVYLMLSDIFFALIGFVFLLLITILETAVAFLQAYVFSMLFTVYVGEVLEGSH